MNEYPITSREHVVILGCRADTLTQAAHLGLDVWIARRLGRGTTAA